MEGRQNFEAFTDALGGRRRRAEAMVRSLRRAATAEGQGGRPAADAVRPFTAASLESPTGTVVFDDAATLAEEAINDLGEAECELHQQNEALFQAQVELDERSRYYHTLFELAPAAYVVTNGLGVIRELNQAATTLLNRPRNFAVGKPLALFVEAGAERASFRTAINRLLVADAALSWPVRLSPGGRGRVDVSVNVRAVRDAQGNATTLYWLLVDDTARVDEDLL